VYSIYGCRLNEVYLHKGWFEYGIEETRDYRKVEVLHLTPRTASSDMTAGGFSALFPPRRSGITAKSTASNPIAEPGPRPGTGTKKDHRVPAYMYTSHAAGTLSTSPSNSGTRSCRRITRDDTPCLAISQT